MNNIDKLIIVKKALCGMIYDYCNLIEWLHENDAIKPEYLQEVGKRIENINIKAINADKIL